MWFKETPRSPFVLGNRGVSKLYTVFICSVIAAAGLFYWYASQLVVVMLPEHGAKACFAVEPGETWQMEFKHSYELTLWRDNFTVNGAEWKKEDRKAQTGTLLFTQNKLKAPFP